MKNAILDILFSDFATKLTVGVHVLGEFRSYLI